MCSLVKRGSLFILILTGANDDHRLNPSLIDAIRAALHQVRSQSSNSSSALLTTTQGKFFSNGYDLAWAKSGGPAAAAKDRLELISTKFRSLISDFISLPMPTIAAVTGHAAAGGFVLALCHDYVLMRKDRGFLFMSELDLGLPIPAWLAAVIQCKIGSPMSRRDVLLRTTKLTAVTAAERGIIDSAHDSAEETIGAAVKMGEDLVERGWFGHVYGEIRRAMFSDVLDAIGSLDNVKYASHVAKVPSRL